MDPKKFSWFPKFSKVLERIPDQGLQGEFCRAVVMYGAFGVEPDLSWPLDSLFEGVREDIENSVRSCNENKGGRPSKEERGVSDDAEPGVSGDGKPPVSGSAEPRVSDNDGTGGNPSLYKPNHTTPNHPKPEGEGRAHAGGCEGEFEPPAPDEVRAYFGANGFLADPAEFFDHFEAQGWTRSNGQPVLDWKALARSWCRKQRQFDAEKPPEQRAPVERIPRADNAVDWEAEYAAMGGEG